MKLIKKFENFENSQKTREEMCNMLMKCGYSEEELDVCSAEELRQICNSTDNNMMMNNESYGSRKEMCDMLMKCGYSKEELDEMSKSDLEKVCMSTDTNNMMMNNESYGSRKEMCDMLMKCGYSKEELDVCSGEKLRQICKSQDAQNYNNEEENLEESKRNKIFRGLKENQEQENYMFFGNLKTIKRLVDKMLEMNEAEVDAILSDGHGWATDHIATSKDDIEEVFNFLAGHESSEHDNDELSDDEEDEYFSDKDLEHEMGVMKNFDSFK